MMSTIYISTFQQKMQIEHFFSLNCKLILIDVSSYEFLFKDTSRVTLKYPTN